MTLPRVVFWFGAAFFGAMLLWRYAARLQSLPCPPALGWLLELGLRERLAPTPLILEHMGVRPGMKVLEVGPGVGYMTVPVARRLGEEGCLVAIELQPEMARRTRERIAAAGVENVDVREGDVATAVLEPGAYDLAFLVTVLGEIPNRDLAVAQVQDALKPGGILSFTEVLGDPHYQRRADLHQRCVAAGLEPAGYWSSGLSYTANFRCPRPTVAAGNGAAQP